jgi:hypothetical protein
MATNPNQAKPHEPVTSASRVQHIAGVHDRGDAQGREAHQPADHGRA